MQTAVIEQFFDAYHVDLFCLSNIDKCRSFFFWYVNKVKKYEYDETLQLKSDDLKHWFTLWIYLAHRAQLMFEPC